MRRYAFRFRYSLSIILFIFITDAYHLKYVNLLISSRAHSISSSSDSSPRPSSLFLPLCDCPLLRGRLWCLNTLPRAQKRAEQVYPHPPGPNHHHP